MVFAGTSQFAVPSLRALRAAGHRVELVVTQPDRPAGRGMSLAASPVKSTALELGLPVEQPEKIRAQEFVNRLRGLAPDLLVVVAYGQIIPRDILDVPRLGAVNVHASLLPRWRGAAPVAHAILAGDDETGVTIMRMDEQLDHGPILTTWSTRIAAYEDAVELTARLAEAGAALLVDTIARLDQITPREQDHANATIASKLSKSMGALEGTEPAEVIDRHVRALQAWPGVTLRTPRGPVKVLRGHVLGDRYVPDVVQLPGKRPAPAKQVLGDA